MPRPTARSEDAAALLALLAHDMRVPLGPLALATSSLATDPALDGVAREYAQIAAAQAGRIGRLLSATLAASGRLPRTRPSRRPISRSLAVAHDTIRALGGMLASRGEDGLVDADPNLLSDTIVNIAEVAAGSSLRTEVVVSKRASLVLVAFACADPPRVVEALTKTVPDDADSAFAIASSRVLDELGGSLSVGGGRLVAALPEAR